MLRITSHNTSAYRIELVRDDRLIFGQPLSMVYRPVADLGEFTGGVEFEQASLYSVCCVINIRDSCSEYFIFRVKEDCILSGRQA